jgi:cobalt-zinc-cadmium efflux system protein
LVHDHSHGGTSHGTGAKPRVLQISLAATFAYIVLLIVAGVRAHSLALLSEAGHNVSDFLALLLSLAAMYLGARPASIRRSYGYSRAGVLAAFVNSLTLVGVAFYIFYEAGRRLYVPEPVHASIMIGAAAAGVIVNGIISALLFKGSDDLNIRAAFIHMLGDALSTAAVIAGGAAIMFTGQSWIDPALSFGIGAMILWSSFGIIRETLNILLEGTPRGVDPDVLTVDLKAIAGVNDVHDLHVWSIGSGVHALSCHIAIADIPPSESEVILRNVQERLRAKFHIDHTTIQFEHAVCEVAHGCVIPVDPRHGEQGHVH